MTYDELTDEQKAVLQNGFIQPLRSWCGEQAKASNHGAVLQEAYAAQALPILNLLGDSDVVPNLSGLAGAQGLTVAQIKNINNYALSTQAFNSTDHRGQMLLACGAVNLIG